MRTTKNFKFHVGDCDVMRTESNKYAFMLFYLCGGNFHFDVGSVTFLNVSL